MNSVVNVLLQELENVDGVVVFATNLAATLDPAFERRIRTHVLFEMPGVEERERIWARPEAPYPDAARRRRGLRCAGGAVRGDRRRHPQRGPVLSSEVRGLGRGAAPAAPEPAGASPAARPPAARPRTNLLWAQLMQRSVGLDVLASPRCGDRFELIALIETRAVIERILTHLGLPTTVPAARPARAPPLSFEADHEPA